MTRHGNSGPLLECPRRLVLDVSKWQSPSTNSSPGPQTKTGWKNLLTPFQFAQNAMTGQKKTQHVAATHLNHFGMRYRVLKDPGERIQVYWDDHMLDDTTKQFLWTRIHTYLDWYVGVGKWEWMNRT